MKSLLPIDESWTVRTFTRAVGQASSILRHNNLPDTSKGAKPFATLLEQQSNLIGNLTAGIKNVGDTELDFEYKQEDQSKAIKSSLADDIKGGVYAGDIVLFLDTLKVSTIETSAESTDARGGWGK